jgi:hypothetical protein
MSPSHPLRFGAGAYLRQALATQAATRARLGVLGDAFTWPRRAWCRTG